MACSGSKLKHSRLHQLRHGVVGKLVVPIEGPATKRQRTNAAEGWVGGGGVGGFVVKLFPVFYLTSTCMPLHLLQCTGVQTDSMAGARPVLNGESLDVSPC